MVWYVEFRSSFCHYLHLICFRFGRLVLGCWYALSGVLSIRILFFLAFVIGSAIPQVQTIIALIASVAILQFTYTFPTLLRFGYDVITDAMAEDSPFVPGKGTSGRIDNWNQWSRWKRVSSWPVTLDSVL